MQLPSTKADEVQYKGQVRSGAHVVIDDERIYRTGDILLDKGHFGRRKGQPPNVEGQDVLDERLVG